MMSHIFEILSIVFLITFRRSLCRNGVYIIQSPKENFIFKTLWNKDHGVDLPTNLPLIIAHRGSSGMMPEHTLEAYQLAIDQGADVIECDVTMTKDLHLICMHESWMSSTTNVADVFPQRLNTYFVPDQLRNITDYFSIDFTLSEIKQIKKRQRYDFRDPNYNDLYFIPTVKEYIELVKAAGRPVGLHIESKDPLFMNSVAALKDANTTFEDLLVDMLHSYGYTVSSSPCFIQSFDENSLRYLSNKTQLPLVMLVKIYITDDKLLDLSKFCYAIAPEKHMLVAVNLQNQIINRTDLVEKIHALGMRVHAWTCRNEYQYLAWDYGQDPVLEYLDLVNIGVDGLFTDFPATFYRLLNFTSTYF